MPNSQEAMVTLSAGGAARPVSIKEKIAFRMKTNPFNAVNP
jgi:hypothetical protein